MNSDDIKFSVIIPCFNAKNYLTRCIESILAQRFSSDRFEIIIVDDCSSDDTPDFLRKINHTNVRVFFHSENQRQGGARNTGIAKAKGEWLMFVDADDRWISNDVLSHFDRLISQNPDVDVVRSVSYTQLSTTSQSIRNFDPDLTDISSVDGKTYCCTQQFFYNIWTSAYKKKYLIENKLYFRSNHVFEDSDWAEMTFFKAKSVLLFNFPFYGYSTTDGSTTNNYSIRSYEDNVLSVMEIERLIDDLGMDDDSAAACRQRIKRSLMTFIKLSRHYSIKDSVMVLSNLDKTELLSLNKYKLTLSEKILLLFFKYNKGLLVSIIHLLTKAKRAFRNYNKRKK